jgi:hypothetical protein
VGPGGSCKQRVSFSSPGALKTYANLWEGRNLVIPIQCSINREDMGGPWDR